MVTPVSSPTATKVAKAGSASKTKAAKGKRKSSLGGKVIAPKLKAKDDFDSGRARADGSLLLGHRPNGPGQVTLNKAGELLLDGRKGVAANVETARLIEVGASPFARATEAQREALLEKLITEHIEHAHPGKQNSNAVLHRSAAATLMLSIARTADAETRDRALANYAKLMDRETNLAFKTSLLVNLEASKLPLKKVQASVDAARAIIQPVKPKIYDQIANKGNRLEVRQYVMGDFWQSELAANRKRGFKIVSRNENEIVLEKTLKDPNGEKPDVKVHVIMRKEDQNVLRDMNDPDVDFIIYSGHAQLGGIMNSAVRTGPDQMAGDKEVLCLNCRGQQNVGEFKAKYPNAHLSATYSSSYGNDDEYMLDKMYEMIAQRGTYEQCRKSMKQTEMWQPKSNYILPDDFRQIAYQDGDRDGLRDKSPLGVDRFFDPATRAAKGGSNSFQLVSHTDDPQQISGVKAEHAIGYANTAFYYFAEENSASPIKIAQTDRFIPGGWFYSDTDEAIHVEEITENGQTYFQVSLNSRLAPRSKEVITASVLIELQEWLSKRFDKGYDDTDKMRALILVGVYLDLYGEFSNQIDDVLKGFAQKYGFTGPLNYDLMFEALKHEGDDDTATKETLAFLKEQGIRVASSTVA
jgi:hypothetical protein